MVVTLHIGSDHIHGRLDRMPFSMLLFRHESLDISQVISG